MGVKIGLTFKEGHILWFFDSRVVVKAFRPKGVGVTREWKRLRNEKLYDLHSSQIIIRMIKSRSMRWAERVALMEERKGVYRVLVGDT